MALAWLEQCPDFFIRQLGPDVYLTILGTAFQNTRGAPHMSAGVLCVCPSGRIAAAKQSSQVMLQDAPPTGRYDSLKRLCLTADATTEEDREMEDFPTTAEISSEGVLSEEQIQSFFDLLALGSPAERDSILRLAKPSQASNADVDDAPDELSVRFGASTSSVRP